MIRTLKKTSVCLFPEFAANDRNRLIYVRLKLAGFKETERASSLKIPEKMRIQRVPEYPKVLVMDPRRPQSKTRQ
jgi:hypothetical protein